MNLKSQSIVILAFTAFAFAAQDKPIDTKDWKSFATKDSKFTIKAPKSWGPANPDDEGTKAAMEKIKANNPQLAKMFKDQDNNFDLYLFDYNSDPLKGMNNLNLKTIKDAGLTPSVYPDLASIVIKQANLKNSGFKVLDLPAGKTLNYWGELGVALGEGASMTFKVNGYICMKDNMTYICTMTSAVDADKVQKPIFDAMAKAIVLK